MKLKCVILLFTIVYPSGGEGLCENDQFSRVNFSDVSSNKLTSNMEMRSLTTCAKYCMTENGCMSFAYTENNRICDTYSKALLGLTAASSSSTKFFTKPPPSDVYDYPVAGGPTIQVYLDMDTADSPWIVIQRRINADVVFYRNWADYKNGFGDLQGNFWLGNDNIHLLTSIPVILRVELEGWDGTTGYAQYSSFHVANEAQNYRLSVSGFTGNVLVDAFGTHDGSDFSTNDRDNDLTQDNCAVEYKGGWWYNTCHESNLNGLYMVDNGASDTTAIVWKKFPWIDRAAPLRKSTMMIRKL
ncbi:angiopoietin-related protein 7-like [Argopecten irradians]|uniref:angiopoietin-related protein 7-like n=1 Tax=Argopecten irradians TaxID=31199 RepID=UPI00371E76B4